MIKCTECFCYVNGEKCQYGHKGVPNITIFNFHDGQRGTKDCPSCKTLEQYKELLDQTIPNSSYGVGQGDDQWYRDKKTHGLKLRESCAGCWALRCSQCTLDYDNQCRNKFGTLLLSLEPCPKPLTKEEFLLWRFINHNTGEKSCLDINTIEL